MEYALVRSVKLVHNIEVSLITNITDIIVPNLANNSKVALILHIANRRRTKNSPGSR